MRTSLVLVALLPVLGTADVTTELGGHTKLRVVTESYPSDSVFRDIAGDESVDALADLRLNLTAKSGRWRFDSAYQLAGLSSQLLPVSGVPTDDRRALDLTDNLSQGSDHVLLHRLDRLWVGYASEKLVLRVGRQALSWGNGIAYAPMDLVNPFDPASIDTEYKAGDDMLYLQYLQDNGNDVQAAWVLRRDPASGSIEDDESTMAIKYHGFVGTGEIDVLLARSYGDTVLGIGGSRGIGGAVWSADLVLTETARDRYAQLATNLLYSWNFAGKNMSGSISYYFNGFGQRDGRYDPQSLAMNPDLLARLIRGESFAPGRHYLAGSVLVEMSPLWSLAPTTLVNIEDPSALLQLVSSYSLGDNMSLLASLNLPLGARGSEFGGIESGTPGRYFSRDAGLFAQFAWYF